MALSPLMLPPLRSAAPVLSLRCRRRGAPASQRWARRPAAPGAPCGWGGVRPRRCAASAAGGASAAPAEGWLLHFPDVKDAVDLVRLGLESHGWRRRPGDDEVWLPGCERAAAVHFVDGNCTSADCPDMLRRAAAGSGLAALVGKELVAEAHRDPGGLMYDLDQLGLLPAASAARFEAARAEAAQLAADGAPGVWWRQPAAGAALGSCLGEHHLCVADGFLPEAAAEAVAAAAEASRGDMKRGEHGLPDSASGPQQNLWRTIKAAWSSPRVRGDHLVFWSEKNCPDPAAITVLASAMQDLCATAFQGLDGVERAVWRSEPQVACYPAGPGRYCKHTDEGACPTGRVLTMIYYCNRDWSAADGGALRIWAPGLTSGRIVTELLPLHNRLVVFRSDPRVPHEVLCSNLRDRYAVTVWSYSAYHALRLPDTLNRIVQGQMLPFGVTRERALALSAEGLSEQEALTAAVAALTHSAQQQGLPPEAVQQQLLQLQQQAAGGATQAAPASPAAAQQQQPLVRAAAAQPPPPPASWQAPLPQPAQQPIAVRVLQPPRIEPLSFRNY